MAQYIGNTPTNVLVQSSEVNDLTAIVTWANVPDANITESSVTQHQAALSITESQISDLQSYLTSSSLTGYATESYVTGAISGKADSSSLATVATSGSYLDLTNTPSIPSTTSDLTNDSGFITTSALTGYATESYVGTAIANLVDSAPTALNTLNELAAALGDDANFATTIATSIGSKLAIADFNSTFDTRLGTKTTSNLAEGTNLYYTDARVGTYLTTNSYATQSYVTTAISGKADTSSLSAVATSGSYNDLTNKPTLFSGSYNDLTNKPTIPTATSGLTNDSGFITTSALTGYATENYVDTAVSNVQVDLTGYATESYVTTAISGKADSSSLATVATSGSYDDLTDKPTIPSLTLQQVNTAGTATESYTNITTLQFDEDSGFDVTNPSAGIAKVAMNSTFKYWEINGTAALTAIGLDTVNFVSGDGITLSANNSSSPKTFTISTDLKTINGNSIIGSGDLVVTPLEQVVTTTTTSAELMDSFEAIAYRSAEYFVTTSSEDGFSAFKVILVHDDSEVYHSTNSIVGNTSSGDITANISSGTVNVYFTATNASTQVKFIRTTISGSAIAQMPLNLSEPGDPIDLENDYGVLDLN